MAALPADNGPVLAAAWRESFDYFKFRRLDHGVGRFTKLG